MKKECKCKECKCQQIELIDIFDTPEFKDLPLRKKLWLRLKVAFFETISMH